MHGTDPNRLERLGEALTPLFYALMLVSLLAIFVGAAGSGAALLILGGCVHVVRASCTELAARSRARKDRLRLAPRRRRPVPEPMHAQRPPRRRRAAGGVAGA